MKINQLLLYREIIAVCSDIHTKHINTMCWQSVEFFNLKRGGTTIKQLHLKHDLTTKTRHKPVALCGQTLIKFNLRKNIINRKYIFSLIGGFNAGLLGAERKASVAAQRPMRQPAPQRSVPLQKQLIESIFICD
jgi:hypothetical protein